MAIMALREITGKGPSLNMRRLACLYRDVRVRTHTFNEGTGLQSREGVLERLKKVTKLGSTEPRIVNSRPFPPCQDS